MAFSMAQPILHSSPFSSSLPRPSARIASPYFNRGSNHVFWIGSSKSRVASKAASMSVRCEQSTKQGGGGADVWLGRLAMVGFATAITVEVSTGKGIVENFGVATPAPTLAFVVTVLVVGLTAFFIFQSASRN